MFLGRQSVSPSVRPLTPISRDNDFSTATLGISMKLWHKYSSRECTVVKSQRDRQRLLRQIDSHRLTVIR